MTAADGPDDGIDKQLEEALLKAYSARATLFHKGVRESSLRALFRQIDQADEAALDWSDLPRLGIDPKAVEVIRSSGMAIHQVFAHPELLRGNPRLVAYYRNLVAISQKGMSQLARPTIKFERANPARMSDECASDLSRVLNQIASRVVLAAPRFRLQACRDVAFAELGTELQGTWANTVGIGAAKAVQGLLADFVAGNNRGSHDGHGRFQLANGWQILFGSEPDISFVDGDGVERIVVEIKGSLDRAGAQTRYGEAKKTFAKALLRNPRCFTVYLASCFTEAVMRQVEADGQVRWVANLTAVLYNSEERERFLKKLFYEVDRPT